MQQRFSNRLLFTFVPFKNEFMKKIISLTIVFFAVMLTFSSCKKKSLQATIDHEKIVDYVKANGLKGQYTASGIFYVISNAGSAQHPTASSTVTVTYKGYLLDGTVFDQENDVSFALPDLIKGWQQGLPLIGTGGIIKLIIPSGLGYGSAGSTNVPANAVLVFDITLLSFTN